MPSRSRTRTAGSRSRRWNAGSAGSPRSSWAGSSSRSCCSPPGRRRGIACAPRTRGTPPKLAVQAWLLALGAVGLLTANLALRAPLHPSALERALRRRVPEPERPLQLERIERELVLGCGSAFDLHHRLRPTLREIAAQ